MPLPSRRAVLRSVRDWSPTNRAATSLVRALSGGRPPAWAVQHLPRHGVVRIEVPGGRTVSLWAGDDWLTSRVWWLGLRGFEPEVVTPFLRFAREARTILDVGAYTGYYALLGAAVNPDAAVYAFEPNPVVAAGLGRNCALNPDLRITVLPFAVGARRAVAELHLGGAGLASSSSLSPAWASSHGTVRTAVVDLASFAQEWGLESVDLIKIDVETTEPDVVEGLGDLLRTAQPVMFVEILPRAADRYEGMGRALADADYEFFALGRDGSIRRTGTLHEPPADLDATNFLLCPAGKVPAWLRAAAGAPDLVAGG